jgi:hypothetical protein
MKTRITILLALLLLVVPFGSRALAQKAYITNVIVTPYRDYVYIYFNIEGCFTPEMEEAVKSGISTAFTFHVNLKRHRGGWFDSLVENNTFRHVMKYDSLLDRFTVIKEEDGKRPVVVKDFEEAKLIMARVRSYPIFPLKTLKKGETYRLEIKGELDKVDIPKSLRYVLFFISLWEFETEWYVEEFEYR